MEPDATRRVADTRRPLLKARGISRKPDG